MFWNKYSSPGRKGFSKIKEIKEMGFGTILYKPVDLEDLAGAVKSALEIK